MVAIGLLFVRICVTASSREGGWKRKSWSCGISSMFYSSPRHIDCMCVGPTATKPPRESHTTAATVPPDRVTRRISRNLPFRNEKENQLGGRSGKPPVLVFQLTGIAYFERRLVAGPTRLRVGNGMRGQIDTDHAPSRPPLGHGQSERSGAATDIDRRFREIPRNRGTRSRAGSTTGRATPRTRLSHSRERRMTPATIVQSLSMHA
jgi:hypothetical protein